MSQATQSGAQRPSALRTGAASTPAPASTLSPLCRPDFSMYSRGFLRLSPRHALLMSKVFLSATSSWWLVLGQPFISLLPFEEKSFFAFEWSWEEAILSFPVSEPHTASGVRWGQPPLGSLGTRTQRQNLRVGRLLSESEKSLLLQLVGQGKCSPSLGRTRLPPPLTGAGAFVPHKRKVKKLLNCTFLSPCHVSL